MSTPANLSRRLETIRDELETIKAQLDGLVVTDMGEADLMGVKEVGEALNISAALVSTWLARGKLPAPVARLASGPVWTKRQIEPLIRLAQQQRRAS